MPSTAVSSQAAFRASPKPSTPVKAPTTAIESPGNWRHPRLSEITRRQGAAVFTEKNVRAIVYNVLAFILLVVLQVFARRYGPSQLITGQARIYVRWGYWLLQLIPWLNIANALLPLLRKPDDLSDIPLTPGQRKLLGLPPSSAPPTPGSIYSTPPRYSRTPSLAGSAASNRSYGSSPQSVGRGSPASGGRLSGSPAAAASPLLHKAIAGGINGAQRRSSFGTPIGTPSPLGGVNMAANLFAEGPGTPSPTPGKRSSVGLNNKWLYDRGRKTSSSSWLH